MDYKKRKEIAQELKETINFKINCNFLNDKYSKELENDRDMEKLMDYLSHYLDDEDIRLKDFEYKEFQELELKKFIAILESEDSLDKLENLSFLHKS